MTDFGMSKLAGAASNMTPLTMCPGTQAYMPPEAVREPPRYTKKLDCFSEGVIMIQVCTRLWPDPRPRTKLVLDTRSPTGSIEMPVLEPVRRKSHIDLINPNHTLLPIAKDCLHYGEQERPSSEELCQRLASLKESLEYSDSLKQEQSATKLKDNQLKMQAQELQAIKKSLQQAKDEIRAKSDQIQEKDKAIQEQLQELASQKNKMDRRLEEQEKITLEVKKANQFLLRQIQHLKHQLSQQNEDQPSLPPPSVPPRTHSKRQTTTSRELLQSQSSQEIKRENQMPVGRKMMLNWKDVKRAPFKMNGGAAVVDKHLAYFVSHSGVACVYDSISIRWSELPKCPYKGCSLAIIRGHVTAIGGYAKMEIGVLNKLFSLKGGEWVEHFPPMPTRRYNTAAVTTHNHLIVAGGEEGIPYHLNTVEVMDIKALVWSTVVSLPHPYTEASATICGDQLYMLGGYDEKDRTKSVLTCSVTDLVLSSSTSQSVWFRVADAPAYYSTCAAVNGELLAIGGCDVNGELLTASGCNEETATDAIHMYNPTMNAWNPIGNMPTAKCDSLVAVFSTNEMLVVGGTVDAVTITDEAKLASFTPSITENPLIEPIL